jgi:hemerythrin-like domain-containing protein
MQRHPALRKLSSDHHQGLVIARKAARAADDPARRQRVWQEVRELFRQELEPHFQTEEAGLLPALERVGETTLVDRTLREHALMRRLIAQDRKENLAPFAELLRSHIRFEEQALFETAQRCLGDRGLKHL